MITVNCLLNNLLNMQDTGVSLESATLHPLQSLNRYHYHYRRILQKSKQTESQKLFLPGRRM